MMRWLFSKTIRDASALQKHVYRLLCAQRDLMTPAAIQLVSTALTDLRTALQNKESVGKIREKMWALEEVGNKWLKPYPNPLWRENVEVLLVAIAVAMAIRTFFLQPFKIPTGSMQPTLYGVTSEPDYAPLWQAGQFNSDQIKAIFQKITREENDLVIPSGWQRFKDWFHGISYVHVVAPADGQVQVEPMVHFLIFNLKQTLIVGGVPCTIWFPPDFGESQVSGLDPLVYRAGLVPGRKFRKGDDVVKLEVGAGDHLFVDRLTYNFRKPERGEIVVFETKGIPEEMRNNPPYWVIPDNEFYIKRLCGLSGETISLHQDYLVSGVPSSQFIGQNVPVGNLVANGQEITAETPRFENLYSFDDPTPGAKILSYQENHYYGNALLQKLSPGQSYQIQTNYLFVMGDNTMDSLDSRYWGDFPATAIVGKSFFVYWPLTSRFGWGNQ